MVKILSVFSNFVILVMSQMSIFALADERQGKNTSRLELDLDNRPIVKVILHSLNKYTLKKNYKFILDTGCMLSILDSSIPADFYFDEAETSHLTGMNGTSATVPVVSIKRLVVAGITRDDVPAVRMDLKAGITGCYQDDPVDGVLGMSFLQGLRFTLDVPRKRIEWWGKPWPGGTKLPLFFQNQKVPLIALELEGKQMGCVLDTGMSGGLTLPLSLRPTGKGKPTLLQGITQGPEAVDATGETLEVSEVKAGGASWKNVEVTFMKDCSSIGTEIWSAGPACFDFVTGHLTLATQNGNDLAIDRNPRLALPLAWDRSRKPPRLVIPYVQPESRFERAGFLPKDEIVQVGTLKRLTLGAIQDLAAAGQPLRWVVLRDGKQIELKFPPEEEKPPSSDSQGKDK